MKKNDGPGRPGERCPGANEPGKPGDNDPGKTKEGDIGGFGEREPGTPRDNGLGNAGETDVDRGCSPDDAGGTGSGEDGGRPGDGVSLGDLLKRRGATTGEAVPFLSPPISKGGGTRIKPVCVSVRNLFMSNCLASSSEIDPTDPKKPLTESEPCVDVDAKDAPEVEVDVDIEVEAEGIVFGVDAETKGETNFCESEPSFAWPTLPCSGSPGTSFSVWSDLTECIDPFRELALSKVASAAE